MCTGGACSNSEVEYYRIEGEKSKLLGASLPDSLDTLPSELRRRRIKIGRLARDNDALANFPARSPDMTPNDYFLWGTLKALVYSRAVGTTKIN